MALPAGTVVPCRSTSRGDVAGDVRGGGLEPQQLLDRVGTSERSSTSARRWSGWSPSTLPIQPMSRFVVSFPAPATTLT